MTEKDKHWEADHLVNTGIYQIQLSIEEYKADIKRTKGNVLSNGMTKIGAIHALKELRSELEVFEYMQDCLDLASSTNSTVKKIDEYLTKVKKDKK